MGTTEWTRILSPPDIVRVSTRLPETAFARIFGIAPLLAIGVPPGDLAPAAGLELAVSNIEDPAPSGIGRLEFHTVVAERCVARPQTAAPSIDSQTLIRLLASGPRHIIRLEKRVTAKSAYSDRISVGRALKGDIVLRHRSISKFHAYFQRPDGESWSIVDAGSTNGTSVNGTVIAPRQHQPLAIGDEIEFGSINAVFLDAVTLWRILHVTS